jgi:hypothetical protein
VVKKWSSTDHQKSTKISWPAGQDAPASDQLCVMLREGGEFLEQQHDEPAAILLNVDAT